MAAKFCSEHARYYPERTGYGFRTGSIEVINAMDCGTHQAVIVKVGDATIDVTCTRAGRRAYVTIRDGSRTNIVKVDRIAWSNKEATDDR